MKLPDLDRPLQDDGSVIQFFVDEMNGAARDLYAVIDRLLLDVEAGK